jgi:SAM-dependent methyltransferase
VPLRLESRDPQLVASLACPSCGGRLSVADDLRCLRSDCGAAFAVEDGVPILLAEGQGVFGTEDVIEHFRRVGRLRVDRPGRVEMLLRFLPGLTGSPVSKRNFARFGTELLASAERPRVLVVGGGKLGEGMEELARNPAIRFIPTDVYISDLTLAVCDGHCLPFTEGSFDGVIVQAVLEHVMDPDRVAQEIWRVLKPGGIVYAETPFLAPVHEGRYDFTRFTRRGHRRLFRRFDEIASGAVHGPGTTLATAYRYFLRSFVKSRLAAGLILVFASLTAFWMKYCDRFLLSRPHADDAAAGFSFLGRKGSRTYSDREIVGMYD